MGEDVEASSVLITDDGGEGVLVLLAEAYVHHAGVERLTPHAVVKPCRAGPGASDGTGKQDISSDGVHEGIDSR